MSQRNQKCSRAAVYAPGVKAMSSNAVRLASSSADVSLAWVLFRGSMIDTSSELRFWMALT